MTHKQVLLQAKQERVAPDPLTGSTGAACVLCGFIQPFIEELDKSAQYTRKFIQQKDLT